MCMHDTCSNQSIESKSFFTRKEMRRGGIGKALVPKGPGSFAHIGPLIRIQKEQGSCVQAAATWKSSSRPPRGLPAAWEIHPLATPVCCIFREYLRVLYNLGYYHFFS